MQIDFHHTTTYVLARNAGYNPDDARVIAYAAQYVDDADNDTVRDLRRMTATKCAPKRKRDIVQQERKERHHAIADLYAHHCAL